MKQLLLYSFLSLFFFAPNTTVSIIGGEEAVVCSDLVVEVERDCSNAEQTGTYTLNVAIQGGVPPYTISGSLNDTLEEEGFISIIITEGEVYEVAVVDAAGNEFFEMGSPTPCYTYCEWLEVTSIEEIAHCLCDGSMVVTFEPLLNVDTLTHIEAYWYDGTMGGLIEAGDTISANDFVELYLVQTTENCYSFHYNGTNYIEESVSNLCPPEAYTLQANDDFAYTEPDEAVTINVLQNDTGTNLQINQIVSPPSCGEILEINYETGEIVYKADANTTCSFDTFVYQAINECGNLMEGTVTIAIYQTEDNLIVEVERDCCLVDYTGLYTLSIYVYDGLPPYTISGTINEVLEEAGIVSVEVDDGQTYEISVVDANNNTFYETGGQISCAIFGQRTYIEDIDEITDCTCSGEMIITLELLESIEVGTFVYGFWRDENHIEHPIAVGDTIPSNAYVEIWSTEIHLFILLIDGECYGVTGNVSDFCTPETYTLQANDDFASTKTNEAITIYPLQNDIGINLQLNHDLYALCGEILEVNHETGAVSFMHDTNANCSEGGFIYEAIDECGNVDQATVLIEKEGFNDFWVQVEEDCTGACYDSNPLTVHINISGGTSPYYISGSITDTLEEAGTVSFTVDYNDTEFYTVKVKDAVSNEYNYSGFWEHHLCDGGCCGYFAINSIDEIANCLADGSMVLTLEGIPNHETVYDIDGYWYNGIEMNDLQIGDTIPSNAAIQLNYVYVSGACYYFDQEAILLNELITNLCFPSPISIEAHPDFAATNTTESITFNVLENDMGEGIFIQQIIKTPPCGEAEIIDGNVGTIRYTPEPNCFLSTVIFEYLLEDTQGNQAIVPVYVVIQETQSTLAVDVEKDCSVFNGINESILKIIIADGTPPFTISGTLNTTVQEIGIVRLALEDGLTYEVSVTDGAGNEFTDFGGDIACGFLSSYIAINKLEDIASCTCEGGLIFDFEGLNLNAPITDIDGYWENSSGENIPIELGVAIPPNVDFQISEIRLEGGIYYFLRNESNYDFIEGNTSNFCPTPCIEANTDLTTTSPTEPITFNVLENDTGEGIFIKGITKPPFCGTVEIIDSQLGLLQYTPDESCSDKLLSFDYQIEDTDGNRAIGTVKIVINQDESELVVAVERDCCADVWQSGVYPLHIYIVDGTPPFYIFGNLNATMEDFGTATVEIEDGFQYEVSVVDAAGNEFFEIGGETACNSFGGYICSELNFQTDYLLQEDVVDCLCDGSLIVHFNFLAKYEMIESIYGFWYANDQVFPIEVGDTIPPNTHFQIFEVQTDYANYLVSSEDGNNIKYDFLGGYSSDFCSTPCIEAHTDLTSTSPTEPITFNVLENDMGEGIFIKGITKQPLCGTVEVINSGLGEVRYTPEPNCFMETLHFMYQIEDLEGNLANAPVYIVIDAEEKDLVVDVKKDCSISDETGQYSLELAIAKGSPPFTITGSIETTLEDVGFLSIEIEDGLTYEIQVEDAVGNIFHETGGEIACTTLGPYLIVHQLSEIAECTCDGGLTFHFEGLDLNAPIIHIDGYWIDEWGNSNDIELGEAIPNSVFFTLLSIETENEPYAIRKGCSDYFIDENTSNFCTPKTPPIPTLNESESQTLICGEGEIILTADDAGEGATYNWYYQYDPFFSWEVPADPPTGQTWVNSEMVGPRIIYLVVTDANGCQSEPLAISTYSFGEIKAEDLEVEIEAQNCDRYRVSFLIIGGNGAYRVNGQPTFEQFLSDWIPIEQDYSFTIDDSDLIPNCEPITVSGSAMDLECLPVAEDDFRTNVKGENTSIQVLTNDTGKDIQLAGIVSAPTCGNIENIDPSTGTIIYQGDIAAVCEEDQFEYEIIDADGNTDIGVVSILFVNNSTELVVHVSSDCSDQYAGGTYDLTIKVLGGVPPFEISGIIGSSPDLIFDTFHYTLENFGEVTGTFEPIGYELQVIDAIGNKFEKNDLLPCCKDIEIITQLDCFIENEDTLAVLTYEIINAEGDFILAPPQNDTLQQGQIFEILVINSVECGAELIDTVSCDFTPISNIEHRTSNIQLYPNPSNGNFTLSLQLEQAEAIDMQIMDILGQEKLWQRLQTLPTVERHEFNLDLPSGLYFLQVSGKDWRWTEKVIVR